jgi:O-antigen/teichoic acid export membrane protein
MTLDMVNRLLYVVVCAGGIVAFFGHMRFYTVTGLKVLKNILTIIACATPLTLVYGLFEWIVTGDGKVAYWLFQSGVGACIVGLFYYFLCCMLSKADDREKRRVI